MFDGGDGVLGVIGSIPPHPNTASWVDAKDLDFYLIWSQHFHPVLLWIICKLYKKNKKNFFICYIHNYTEYNLQWNLCSAFNPSKCTHTWSSGQPTLRRPGSSWGFGALLKGLNSVVDNSCRRRDSNPQPRVTSRTLYPLGHDSPQMGQYVCSLEQGDLAGATGFQSFMCVTNCFFGDYGPSCLAIIDKILLCSSGLIPHCSHDH